MFVRSSKSSYVPALDGIRGIAVTGVLLFHAHTGLPFLRGGFIGVDIFFVLSGFLITYLLAKEFRQHQRINLKAFYLRRVLRLGPALLLLLASVVILSAVFPLSLNAEHTLGDALITLFYASNWVRAFQVRSLGYLSHTWSLSIEEQFYLLWPMLLTVLLRVFPARERLLGAVALLTVTAWFYRVALTVQGAPPDRLYNGLDTRADALLIGCALGIVMAFELLSEPLRKRLQTLLPIVAPTSALMILGVGMVANWTGRYMYYGGLFLVEALTAVLILDVLLRQQSVLNRILSHRIWVWIGSISYGLYLWHYPIYKEMSGRGCSPWVIVTAGTALTFLIASGSYYLLEIPFLKMKTRLSSHESAQAG